jgi:hypothetical protein
MRIASRFMTGLLCVIALSGNLMAAPKPPGDNFSPGWTHGERPLHIVGEQLFDYIDGAAELFLEFGFRDLEVHKYSREGRELGLEIYRMENPEAALGMYLLKCGRESPRAGLKARNSADRHQITIVRGSYFILVNNYKGDEALLPDMTALAGSIVKDIPEGSKITLIDQLPREQFISGSAVLFRGPCALQQIYYFGSGDLLLLKKTIFGVAGDYRQGIKEKYTRIIIPYPDKSAAGAAFGSLIENLDQYIKVIRKSEAEIAFRDYNNRFGIAGTHDNVVVITVNLPTEPGTQPQSHRL